MGGVETKTMKGSRQIDNRCSCHRVEKLVWKPIAIGGLDANPT